MDATHAAQLAAIDHAYAIETVTNYGLILALFMAGVWALASLPWTAEEQAEMSESMDANTRALGRAWAVITRGNEGAE
jgi:hypothetical protein